MGGSYLAGMKKWYRNWSRGQLKYVLGREPTPAEVGGLTRRVKKALAKKAVAKVKGFAHKVQE